MKPVFVFIDDSPFEHQAFLKGIVPAAPGAEFIQAETFEQAVSRLEGRHPVCFVLDLYGKDPALAAGGVPGRGEVEAALAQAPGLDAVYQGLDGNAPNAVNEFLKRMFHLMDFNRRLFIRLFGATGQNINYGLGNLKQARRLFPAAACVAYTRKSVIHDAETALAAGMDGLNIKPDAASDEAIFAATAAQAERLTENWTRAAETRFAARLARLALALALAGLAAQIKNLARPDRLSPAALDVLGPDEPPFLRAAEGLGALAGRDLAAGLGPR